MNLQDFGTSLQYLTWQDVKSKGIDILVLLAELAPVSWTALVTYNTVAWKTVNGIRLSKNERKWALSSLPLSYVFSYSGLSACKDWVARTLYDYYIINQDICDTICQQEWPTIGSPGTTMALAMTINTILYGLSKRSHIQSILGDVLKRAKKVGVNILDFTEEAIKVDINWDWVIWSNAWNNS